MSRSFWSLPRYSFYGLGRCTDASRKGEAQQSSRCSAAANGGVVGMGLKGNSQPDVGRQMRQP